ncbi:MAG: aminotransferase class V-fold PLP-dependent enzyme [Actinobacteria bacterium]|nr:aminotransferase class V-fold PLP-dependent enzyme [Actinomycetota bacterium]
MNLKHAFSRFLTSDPERLHVAAHSHHPWPDATFDAQQQAWLDAAAMHDDKWDHVFETVIPEAQGHIAHTVGLSDPMSMVFAPNTHEFVLRIISCLPRPARILTTDAEFHSFSRQSRRLQEAGDAVVERVPAEPFATFTDRFADAARVGEHDLVFLSHVFFDSGYVVPDLPRLLAAVPDDATFVVVDGYHAFMALPVDLRALGPRIFYLAGGYKYAMSGEGAVFLHVPPGYGERPVDTGWFAAFSDLDQGVDDRVRYQHGADRFWGSTFDPSALYRFNAVQRLLAAEGIDVEAIHAHVRGLQERFVDATADLDLGELLPPCDVPDRGNFLTFRSPQAAEIRAALRREKVIADHRGDRLRVGFGVYHDEGDVDELLARARSALG